MGPMPHVLALCVALVTAVALSQAPNDLVRWAAKAPQTAIGYDDANEAGLAELIDRLLGEMSSSR